MDNYLALLSDVMCRGVDRNDRTGTGTRSVFGRQMRFNLADGFPLVTTKKVHMKSVIHELLWMISGSTNVRYLQDNDVKIWDAWADEEGNLGPVYGAQWRQFGAELNLWPVDQLATLVEGLKNSPDSRRHIVTAWNPLSIDCQALPPCHCFFQCYVSDGKLSLQLYQRSADMFLGVPFNIASYALLTMMLAKVCNLEVGEFVHVIGDAHIYKNHMAQVEMQLTRPERDLPRMYITPTVDCLFDFRYEDFSLEGYDPHPAIKAPVSV